MSEKRFVGLHLDEPDELFIRLQALLQGRSKADIMRSILEKHMGDREKALAETIYKIAEYMYTQWDLRMKEHVTFSQYLDRKKVSLRAQKIPEETIDKIIQRCKELKSQKKR